MNNASNEPEDKALLSPNNIMAIHITINPLPNKITKELINEIIKDKQNVFFLPITSAIIPVGSSRKTTVIA